MNNDEEIKTIHGSKPIVGVIGGHARNTNDKALSIAYKTGALLAKAGLTVACGGEDGIMEMVAKGAKEAGGMTLAITKSNRKEDANKYIDYVIPTSLDLAFINVLTWSSDAIIAFDGRFGTMCEIGLALDIGKPTVLLGTHDLINTSHITEPYFLHINTYEDEDVSQAIEFVKKKISAY